MFKEIDIQDFLKHSRWRGKFGKITAILGPNGSGKSSILEALKFALYADKIHAYAYAVRKGASVSRIKLEVDSNLRRFVFKVQLGKTRDFSVQVWEDGQKRELSPSEARAMLGLPQDIKKFQTLYYLQQGVFSESPKKLADIVRRSLDIDFVKVVLDILDESLSERKKRVDELKERLRDVDDSFEFSSREQLQIGDVYKRVEELKALLKDLKEKLERLISKREELLLKKKEIERRIEEYEEKERELNDKLGLRKELEGKLDVLLKNLNDLHSEISNVEVDVEGETLDEVQRKKNEVERDLGNLREYRGSLKSMEEMILSMERELKSLEDGISYLLPLFGEMDAPEVKRVVEYSKAMKRRESNRRAYEKYEETEKAIRDMELKLSKLDQVSKHLPELEKIELALGEVPNLDEFSKTLNSLRRRKGSLESELEHERARERAFVEGKGKCPVCGRDLFENGRDLLTEVRKKIDLLEDELARVESEIKVYERFERDVFNYKALLDKIISDLQDTGLNIPNGVYASVLRSRVDEVRLKLQKDLMRLKEELENLKDGYENYIAADRKIRALGYVDIKDLETFADIEDEMVEKYGRFLEQRRKLKDLEHKKRIAWQKMETIRRKYSNVDGDIESYIFSLKQELERKERYIQALMEMEKLERKIGEIKREIESLSDVEEEINNLRLNIQNFRRKRDEITEKIYEIESEMKDIEVKISDSERRLKSLKEILNEWGEIIEEMTMLSDMKSEMEEGQEKFIENRKRMFERLVERFFLDIFGHSVTYRSLKLDDDLMPILTYHNGEVVRASYGTLPRNDEVKLSGGERTALYLSYIMALRELIKDEEGEAKFLILDEPTVHLDGERRKDVWELIDELQRGRNLQIILVTHDTESFNEVLGNRDEVVSVLL